MKGTLRCFSVLATLVGTTLCAQNMAGTWQGTVKDSAETLRVVVEIARADSGGWKAVIHSIDEQPDGYPASAVTINGSHITLVFDVAVGTYEGTIGPDAASIAGTWAQGERGSNSICAAQQRKQRGRSISAHIQCGP